MVQTFRKQQISGEGGNVTYVPAHHGIPRQAAYPQSHRTYLHWPILPGSLKKPLLPFGEGEVDSRKQWVPSKSSLIMMLNLLLVGILLGSFRPWVVPGTSNVEFAVRTTP
jgi:hypothetical protein